MNTRDLRGKKCSSEASSTATKKRVTLTFQPTQEALKMIPKAIKMRYGKPWTVRGLPTRFYNEVLEAHCRQIIENTPRIDDVPEVELSER